MEVLVSLGIGTINGEFKIRRGEAVQEESFVGITVDCDAFMR